MRLLARGAGRGLLALEARSLEVVSFDDARDKRMTHHVFLAEFGERDAAYPRQHRARLLETAALAACQVAERPAAPMPPVSTGKVRVRVFTEPAPVRQLAAAGRYVFVGTADALERWDGDGEVVTLDEHPGRVVAMAGDPDQARLWVVTDAGVGYYDAGAELFSELPPPPGGLGLDLGALAKEGMAAIAPADDGGVWLASVHGLFSVSAQGQWASTAIHEPVRALARDRAGWLWIAARSGLIARRPGGELIRLGPADGLGVATPRIVVALADDRVLVIGADADGHDRLAVGAQRAWATYRALPETRWDAAARRGAGAVVMGGDRVYRVVPASAARARPLARDRKSVV